MEFYDVVKSRRTVRDFLNQEVDKKTIERILSAGLMAPTNDHMRNWEFVVIMEREIIEKIIKPISKNVSESKIESVIKTWKLNDPIQKEMYRDAIPKQY